MSGGMGKWDMHLKALVTENPQDFVSFVLEGAIALEKVEGEFQTREMRSDTLFKCHYKEKEVLVLVELQVKKAQDIGDRLLAYCFEARRKYKRPIKACVIFLKHIADAPQPPHIWDFPTELKMLWFDYLSIEIADMQVEDLSRKVRPGTSPLLLLSKGGAKRETLDQVIHQFEATKKAESLNVTRLIAGLIFTNEVDHDWIERRFALMHDFLWENSWTYRQSVEQGREQGIREDIEAAVKTRFPALVELARERSANLQGEEALRKVLIAMIAASTEKKARRYLLALNG
jgi:hypothetical protein